MINFPFPLDASLGERVRRGSLEGGSAGFSHTSSPVLREGAGKADGRTAERVPPSLEIVVDKNLDNYCEQFMWAPDEEETDKHPTGAALAILAGVVIVAVGVSLLVTVL